MEPLAVMGGKPTRTKPWPTWPVFDHREEDALLAVFRSGNWWRHSYGEGVELAEDEDDPQSAVARFQRDFARYHNCQYGICAANGTVTMEIALRAAGVRPGDEVIVPAYTYVATASAPLMVGAIPIFVDMDPDTYLMDPRRMEEAITERTRAIIPVHFGGQPCQMDEINAIAHRHDLIVVEDAAHAHGSAYKGQMCGSLAEMGSFSFQNSKNMTAGEGGIITTNNASLAEACEALVWAGRQRGEPWYKHFVLASNSRMTEFQGAILSVQLTRLADQNEKRQKNALILDGLFRSIEGITPLKRLPTTTISSYHIYMLRFDPGAFRGISKDCFVQALQAEGITGVMGGYTHPLYQNPMFLEKRFFGGPYPVVKPIYERELNYADFTELCPVTEKACSSEAIWLLQSMLLADEADMADIARAIRKVQVHAKSLIS